MGVYKNNNGTLQPIAGRGGALIDDTLTTTSNTWSASKMNNTFVTDANYTHTDNNYTNAEKSKLDSVATGAEVNVQSDWEVTDNTSDAYIKNKPTIPNLGSGSGRANSLCFREEITEITSDMWQDIYNGNFEKVHVGMHYTAPSGRTYWFGHADYNYGMGATAQDRHTMLVIEDDITITSAHHSTNTTEGGAVASDIYTTVLPAHQGELEADFGAEHIIPQSIYLTNAVTNGVASGGAWASLYSSILTEKQILGNDIRYTDGANYFLNFLARERQLALFANMPETIVAHRAGTTNRLSYWTDTVESASAFGYVGSYGSANYVSAGIIYGVRRAFFIG